MTQVVCNYAPVRFLPYREVGEFVNVGVVVHCPESRFFGHRLVTRRRTGRVSHFFPELDLGIFTAGLEGLSRELIRLGTGHSMTPTDPARTAQLVREEIHRFREITRRREGLLHFGETGTMLADSAEEALNELFGRFVERQFAQRREYQEGAMRARLGRLLRDWELARHYQADKHVGDDDFHVVMPFVHFRDDRIAKVVRPLDLNKEAASDIYHHGGAWVKNMERLKNRDHLPPEVIFTVSLPETGKRLDAAEEIRDEFQQLGVQTVEFADTRLVRAALEVKLVA